ncbi:hypothetical protein [Stieleria mannarensis]|uniref:hypothetical protein n=1 Tax=Stieleria mannarensis TaxID=2755585 RepID=UPI0016027526|nr:hypothetical protein [Rhodopirellula sp. JC639]
MIQLDLNFVSALAKSRRAAAFAGFAALTVAMTGLAAAHHPDRENQTVHPRVDVIGPLGNRLHPSYRRVYNRPTYLGGKLAYLIAPSSQEAMAWHRAVHSGGYEKPKKHLRLEQHYFYPKPYHAMDVGPRRPSNPRAGVASDAEMLETAPLPTRSATEGEPQTDPLPEPADVPELDGPQLELPEIEAGDGVQSSSDAGALSAWEVHVSQSAPLANGTTIAELVSGGKARGVKREQSAVSQQDTVSEPLIDSAKPPIFTPSWRTR